MLILAICLVATVAQASSETYRASVINLPGKPAEVSAFVSILADAMKDSPELVVFPEQSLQQDAAEIVGEIGSVACDTASALIPIQKTLSCAAAKENVYLVFDLTEEGAPCEKDVDPFCYSSHYVYNTALVYDRKGALIAHYRKYHPTGPPFKPGPKELVHFTTDFGVTFGLFICFDVVFRYPSSALVEELKITDFVFPTRWVDMPPGYALPVQQGWSEFYHTNFIAANYLSLSSGSGIYSRGVPLVTTTDDEVKILTADIPLIQWEKAPEIPALAKVPWKEENQTVPFQAKAGFAKEFSLKVDTLECRVSLQVGADVPASAQEVFVVQAARQTLHGFEGVYCGVMNCGVSPDNCGKNIHSLTYFDALKVEIKITGDDMRMAVGLAVTDELDLFFPVSGKPQFDIVHDGLRHELTSTAALKDPILGVGIFGRLNDEL